MWRFLVKIQRGNGQFTPFRNIQINPNLRNGSEEKSALQLKFPKTIRDFLQKMTLALELKSKETDELFTSATKKIEESLKSSNQFFSKEINLAKKMILEVAKTSEVQFDEHKNCLKIYNDGIKVIKENFTGKVRDCTEKTVIQLETIRSRYEDDLQEAKDLKKVTTRALKECLDKKSNIQDCIDVQTKSVTDKYESILEKLRKSSNASSESVTDLLKSASVCYFDARHEVTKNLPKIIETVIDCLKESKENELKNTATIKEAIFKENEADKILPKIITISIQVPKLDNGARALEEKSECLREAHKDAMNTVNLVLHEIESSEKLTDIIKKANKKDPLVQEILRYTIELVQDAKHVIVNCTKNDWQKEAEVDILKCLTDIFDSIKLKKLELMKRIDELKKDKTKSNVEIDKALEWISSSEEKLQKLEKIFQECSKPEKK